MDTTGLMETHVSTEMSVLAVIGDSPPPSFISEIREFGSLLLPEVEITITEEVSSTEPMYVDRYCLPSLLVDDNIKRIIEPYIQTDVIFMHLRRISERRKATVFQSSRKSVVTTDLSTSLSDEAQLAILLQDNAEILQNVTKSHGARLYMVDDVKNELILHIKGTQPRHKINFKIGPLGIVAAHVAYTKEYIVTDDILGDPRFPEGVPWRGPLVKYVLCVPIVTPDDKCIAVIELYKDIYETTYTESDAQVTLALAWWIGAAIYQDKRRLAYRKERDASKYLFETITSNLTEEDQIESIIQEIMAFAKVTTEAERGLFYIADSDGTATLTNVFCDISEMENEDLLTSYDKAKKVASLVIKTKAGINIEDAADHPSLADEPELQATFITNNIMCMPIKDEDEIVGLFELLNKKGGSGFTKDDMNIFKSCAAYASLQVEIARLREKLRTVELKNAVKTDMIAHHIKASKDEIQNLKMQQNAAPIPSDFNSFAWYLYGYEKQLAELALHMFHSMDPEHFTDSETACAFILSIMKGYRDNPYHNFQHGFNVCHCMWNILQREPNVFSQTEKRALMVATLGHDIDHYGCTNNFLHIIDHSLYQLYPQSTLEHHHADVTTFIMKVTNLYKDLPEEEYKEIIRIIKEAIIATDPVAYFTCRSKILNLENETKFDTTNTYHRKLLLELMMSACDLSGQCKPYSISSRITQDLYKEFYHEGDLLKLKGLIPPSIMDRDMTSQIPDDQYNFITAIVAPCMKLLGNLLPNCQELYTLCKEPMDRWKEILDLRDKDMWIPEESVAK